MTGMMRECVACGLDTKHKGLVSTLTCNHTYCYECIARLCLSALRDEQLLPVRCCGIELPKEVVSRALDEEQLQALEAATVEHACHNRMYCPNPQCSTFLGERGCSDKALRTCASCSVSYCASCGDAWHAGVCRQDRTDELELRTLAAKEGWQQCAQCQRIVELAHRCNHMTCKCGYQFCYNCGDRWGPAQVECNCAALVEHRLIEQVQWEQDAAARAQRAAEAQREFAQREDAARAQRAAELTREFSQREDAAQSQRAAEVQRVFSQREDAARAQRAAELTREFWQREDAGRAQCAAEVQRAFSQREDAARAQRAAELTREFYQREDATRAQRAAEVQRAFSQREDAARAQRAAELTQELTAEAQREFARWEDAARARRADAAEQQAHRRAVIAA